MVSRIVSVHVCVNDSATALQSRSVGVRTALKILVHGTAQGYLLRRLGAWALYARTS
jgi:hypothetical protein